MREFYDDKDFASDKMCCTCGGGKIGNAAGIMVYQFLVCSCKTFFLVNQNSFIQFLGACVNTHGNKTDQKGHGCNEYKTSTICGKNDHEEFDSFKMCCSCGGGRFGNIVFVNLTGLTSYSLI